MKPTVADRKNLVAVRESSEVETDENTSKETPEKAERVKNRPLSARNAAAKDTTPSIKIQQSKFRTVFMVYDEKIVFL